MNARLTLLLSATMMIASVSAHAYPDKPVTLVAGYPAGGVLDTGARLVAKILGEKLGQPVIVENKPGANGIIAAEYVAAAKPDGYTLLYSSNSAMAANKFLYRKLNYDPLVSFVPVGGVPTSPLLLVVAANSPFKSVKDIVEYAKRNPGKLNYASTGTGGGSHLVTELFSTSAGIQLAHIPYKGAVQALTDLLGGQIDLAFDYSTNIRPHLESGKVRLLAQTGTSRMKSYPDVPVFAELGYPNVELSSWTIAVGPAALPQPVVNKLSDAFAMTFNDSRLTNYYDTQGANILGNMNPDKLRAFVASEQTKLKDVIERAGVKPE